ERFSKIVSVSKRARCSSSRACSRARRPSRSDRPKAPPIRPTSKRSGTYRIARSRSADSLRRSVSPYELAGSIPAPSAAIRTRKPADEPRQKVERRERTRRSSREEEEVRDHRHVHHELRRQERPKRSPPHGSPVIRVGQPARQRDQEDEREVLGRVGRALREARRHRRDQRDQGDPADDDRPYLLAQRLLVTRPLGPM